MKALLVLALSVVSLQAFAKIPKKILCEGENLRQLQVLDTGMEGVGSFAIPLEVSFLVRNIVRSTQTMRVNNKLSNDKQLILDAQSGTNLIRVGINFTDNTAYYQSSANNGLSPSVAAMYHSCTYQW